MSNGDEASAQSSPLEAAYEQLARLGPVAERSVSLTSVAKATGMGRSNLYRRWPTASDLASDIAVHRSTPDDGWHAHLCIDDGGPLESAIRRSLATRASADGVLTRATVATWAGTRAQERMAAWERAHVVRLVARLRREWGPDLAAPWTDAAIAVTSLMEGMLLMWAQFAAEPGELMPPELAEEVTQTILRVIAFMIHEAEGVDTPIRGEGDELGDQGDPLPPRVRDALAAGLLDPPDDGGRRVIDMGVLARARGVTERSLYNRWPTAADLNGDLFVESVQRVRDAFARTIVDVFQSHATGSFSNTMPLIALMNAWFMDPARFPEARVHLGLAELLSGQAVLDRVRDAVELGLQVADLQTAALLQASGFRLRPDVRTRTYTMLIVGMGMGSHRTLATHPELVDRRLRYLGEEYLAAGVGHTAMTRTCSELIAPPSTSDAAPPTPALLQPPPAD